MNDLVQSDDVLADKQCVHPNAPQYQEVHSLRTRLMESRKIIGELAEELDTANDRIAKLERAVVRAILAQAQLPDEERSDAEIPLGKTDA